MRDDTTAPLVSLGPDILIVDDTPANLELLSAMLGDRGYRVRVATSGPRALQAARASVPNLVMLDINMPGMLGYEVCRLLKADPATAHVPVIFVSALDEVVDKVMAFDAGGADYVTKPFQFGEVLARIENQLRMQRLQRELEQRNVALLRMNEELREAQRREDRTASSTRFPTCCRARCSMASTCSRTSSAAAASAPCIAPFRPTSSVPWQ